MNSYIINGIIFDPDETTINLYIQAMSEEDALSFFNLNYNVDSIISIEATNEL